jgi:hypothetical protein
VTRFAEEYIGAIDWAVTPFAAAEIATKVG